MSDEARSWLDELETAVRQAAETIDALRQERDELAQRVQELDARVSQIEAAGAGAAGTGGETPAALWPEEREEIRRRVERLTERLEGLLEPP